MKILALSDTVVKAIYSPDLAALHSEVGMVIGCGDLPYYYLEFVATALSVPVAYVYGNHDSRQHMSDGRTLYGPEGCIALDGQVLNVNGILMAGLGGSMRYQPGAQHQYTEAEMGWRIAQMIPALIANRLRYGRCLDVLVAHSPPFGIHDGADLPHIGFRSFLTLMRYAKPRYLLHGHKHVYRRDTISDTRYHRSTVVNVYPSRVIELEVSRLAEKNLGRDSQR
jgi:hypothetical protein